MRADSDSLYALPLEEFTAARNALAKELAGAGKREEAEEVRRLAKPTRTAWALNQLARRRPDDVERLVVMGQRLRTAQTAALDGDAAALRTATKEEQELVEELLAHTVEVLGQGARATPATQERIRRTLRAAVLDNDTAIQLREGHLVADAEPSGFDLLALADRDEGADADPGPAGDEETTRADTSRASARETARLSKEAERAAQRARRLWDEAERAERRAAEARAYADETSEAAAEAQRQADEGLAGLDGVEIPTE